MYSLTIFEYSTFYCHPVHPGEFSCTPWLTILYTLSGYPVQDSFNGC